MPHRFHILGIPHTITFAEYTVCAFTQKTVKLCKLLKSLGHEVIHYGHEDSVVECDQHVTVTTQDDLDISYPGHDWRQQGFPPYRMDDHVYQTFYRNAIEAIGKNKRNGDFLLCPFGGSHKTVADAHADMIVCEPGIGYPNGHFARFKVFESYAILHAYLGLPAVAQTSNALWYDVVIPNFFDLSEFAYDDSPDDYLLLLGRVYSGKGAHIAIQLADVTGRKLIVAGAGSIAEFSGRTNRPVQDYVTHVGPVGVAERKRLLSKARASLCISTFLEPFCGVQIESMLSGTPVISTDYGAFAEYNLHGMTGFRGRTFEQLVWAVDNIDSIERSYCRKWAERNFSIERVAKMYDEYFFSVANIFKGNGWYQDNPQRRNLDWLQRYY